MLGQDTNSALKMLLEPAFMVSSYRTSLRKVRFVRIANAA